MGGATRKNRPKILRSVLAVAAISAAAVGAFLAAASASGTLFPAADLLPDPAPLRSWATRTWTDASKRSDGLIDFLLHIYRTVVPKEKPHASAAWIRRVFEKRGTQRAERSSDAPETADNEVDEENEGRSSSPLHLALEAEASGGVSQKRRVGRSCRLDLAPGEESSAESGPCDPENDADNLDAPASATNSCSDIELRPNGAVQAVSPSPPASRVSGGRKENQLKAMEEDDTFPGMILQVLPAELDQKMDRDRAAVETDGDDRSNLVPGRVGGGKEIAPTVPRKCISQREVGLDVENLVQYELVETIRENLGLIDVHSLDYMYKPVFGLPQSVRDRFDEEGEVPTLGSAGHHLWGVQNEQIILDDSDYEVGESDHQSWRLPWLFATKRRREKKRKMKAEDEYERMGDRAFAGGSHGEVWRARRRCPALFSSGEKDGKDDDRTKNREAEGETQCDPKQELVMKRLKLEHGLDLLEAGLREVYFGELLASDPEASSLFTAYVDHFFREGPLRVVPGSSESRPSVELWIVFEDSGPSLRSYIYTSVESGDFYLYTHSPFWRRLRMSVASNGSAKRDNAVALASRAPNLSAVPPTWQGALETDDDASAEQTRRNRNSAGSEQESIAEGRALMKEILKQVLTSAAYLHSKGIVHRDIKPSNVMCKANWHTNFDPSNSVQREIKDVNCVLGDFSSAWDEFTSRKMYGRGPTAAEQTEEYAPPEVLFGPSWVPFHQERPQSYDSWSIGVVALEMLLGTPNVFSVDSRTTVVLTHKMKKKGANADDIRRALYLAALSQFCIYVPNEGERDWPLREGDPLHGIAMAKNTCTLHDFHSALRARDPLGIGFDSSSDSLLQLIWGLLAWNPIERLTPSEALEHMYFKSQKDWSSNLSPGEHNAVESQSLDPRVDMGNSSAEVDEFICPKCGKRFADHSSCQRHTTLRRHAKFCTYDRSVIPPCLNAHSMLPAHPTSGYCDIQGRRKTIEDFHTVHLSPSHQFYGVFDGHNGNLASKYAASLFYEQLAERLSDIDEDVANDPDWKDELEMEMVDAFRDLHEGIIRAVKNSPGGVMSESGTTATILYVTKDAVVAANVGDSRAVMSQGALFDGQVTPIQITVDHIASNSDEKRLVEERGGFISSAGGIERVNGTLAVSRSLGDAKLAPVLSRVPHVVALSTEEIKERCRLADQHGSKETAELPCFIVLASDGLWDVMSNQEVVDMVVEVVRKFDSSHGISWDKGGAFQEAAQMLTQEAYVRGSTDNIGVCVVAIE